MSLPIPCGHRAGVHLRLSKVLETVEDIALHSSGTWLNEATLNEAWLNEATLNEAWLNEATLNSTG